MTKENKTHWLQNPNKNYLGHWDLPNGDDTILTIESAQWEEVRNPVINTTESKRVVRFQEKQFKNGETIKPFICNATNAQNILTSTGCKFMEDSIGKKIMLTVSSTKVARDEVECVRVAKLAQSQLQESLIDEKELKELASLLGEAKKDVEWFCGIMKIDSLPKLPKRKYKSTVARLNNIVKENENN